VRERIQLILSVLGLLVLISQAFAAPPGHSRPTLESLRASVETALRDHNREQFASLVCWDGADEYSRKEFDKIMAPEFDATPDSVTIHTGGGDPWNEPFVEFITPEGHRYQRNLEPAGYVVVCRGNYRNWLMAGRKTGQYYLAWWSHTEDIPLPDTDTVLKEGRFTADETAAVEHYYSSKIEKWTLASRSCKYLGHPYSTVQLRGRRHLLLLLQDALRRAKPRVPQPSYALSNPHPDRSYELRKYIGESARAQFSSGIPLAQFFLDREPDPELQTLGVRMLRYAEGQAVDSLLVDLIEHPRPNDQVTLAALNVAATRHLRIARKPLETLLDRDPEISEAAKALSDTLGYGMKSRPVSSARLQRLLDQLRPFGLPVIPSKAVLVEHGDSPSIFPSDYQLPLRLAWVCPGDSLAFVTQSGQLERHSLADTLAGSDIVLKRWIKPVSEAEKVKEATAWLSDRHSIGANVVTSDILLFLDWLERRGHSQDARLILERLLVKHGSSEAVLQVHQESFGEMVGDRMRIAYAERRFPGTMALAKIVIERYPRSMTAWQAKRLLVELPKRGNDFQSYRLPTPEEWKTLRAGMSRREQIDFLCERLRLLNCYGGQWNPGSLDLGEGEWGVTSVWDTQYREASTVRRDQYHRLAPGLTPVINPCRVMGSGGELSLQVSDIPQLAHHLEDDWLTVGVESSHISRTVEVLAEIINGLAAKPVCNVYDWDDLSRAEKQKRIADVELWVKRR
jgi:hypothetical protein